MGRGTLSLPLRPPLSVHFVFIIEVYAFDVQVTVHRDIVTFR